MRERVCCLICLGPANLQLFTNLTYEYIVWNLKTTMRATTSVVAKLYPKKKKSASFWHILTIETPTSVLAKCANIHNCYSNSAYMRSYCSSSIYYFNIFSLPLHSLFPNSLSPQLIIFATNNPHPYRQWHIPSTTIHITAIQHRQPPPPLQH